MLTIVDHPGTEAWALSDEHAKIITSRLLSNSPVRLEYWPAEQADEPWARDRNHHPQPANILFYWENGGVEEVGGHWYDPSLPGNLRGYSFTGREEGMVAVVFVSDRETYESATFIALHEMAHLLVEEEDDDEIHADLIASVMMTELGYGEGVREALPLRAGMLV